ncbi:hypothetical protein GCM10023339_28870 [Alloalcanivorax gelatiniphagus]
MSTTEERLRAALSARAELVRPEALEPVTKIVALRPRWQSPWVLLATAAVVLLVLGVALQGLGRDPRSDDVAPRPDDRAEPRLPPDVGRDWPASPESTPARVDLDGDGTKERVQFLAEKTEKFDGRVRLQTTLTSTGEGAYGVVDVESTIGVTADGVVDADGDGDQELVVFDPDIDGSDTNGGAPLVLDLRDGLLVRAEPAEPGLLVRGDVQVPGSPNGTYDLVRVHQYWIADGALFSGRSEDSFARTGMDLLRPQEVVLETWKWRLDDDGVLRPEPAGCAELVFDVRDCDADSRDRVPDLGAPVDTSVGVGGRAELAGGYPFSARVEAGDPPVLVVEGFDGRTLRHQLDVPDPRLLTVQPQNVFGDGASLVVTSGSDPTLVQVLVQRDDRMVVLAPDGEVPLENTDETRTWLTADGWLVSAVAADDGTWLLWTWQMTSRRDVAAIPWRTVCLDDPDDPTSLRAC